MTLGRVVVFIIIYAIIFFALDRIHGTAFDLVGLGLQAVLIGVFILAAKRVHKTPTKRGFIDENGHYQEKELD